MSLKFQNKNWLRSRRKKKKRNFNKNYCKNLNKKKTIHYKFKINRKYFKIKNNLKKYKPKKRKIR